jgi:hypothetical protein
VSLSDVPSIDWNRVDRRLNFAKELGEETVSSTWLTVEKVPTLIAQSFDGRAIDFPPAAVSAEQLSYFCPSDR